MQTPMRTTVLWPRPQKTLIALMAVNLGFYILQLIALRAGISGVSHLYLVPREAFQGAVWQPFTYFWFHDPTAPSHLLFNMLFLYLFGSHLERWWGPRRFLLAYWIFGVSGAFLTLFLALVFGSDPAWLTRPHLGASGAVMGMTVAWGLAFANREFHFLLLGKMKGKTFVALAVGFELLTALSFSNISSSSHFGGMIAAFVLSWGLWRPSRWLAFVKNAWRRRKAKAFLQTLRVIPGGQSEQPGTSSSGRSSSSARESKPNKTELSGAPSQASKPKASGLKASPPWGFRPEDLSPPDPNDPSRWN